MTKFQEAFDQRKMTMVIVESGKFFNALPFELKNGDLEKVLTKTVIPVGNTISHKAELYKVKMVIPHFSWSELILEKV